MMSVGFTYNLCASHVRVLGIGTYHAGMNEWERDTQEVV